MLTQTLVPSTTKSLTPVWRWLLGIAIILGIGFRLWPIDHKVYWHDEAYTTFRAAGYLETEIFQALSPEQPMAAPELLQFQRLKPDSSALDTLRSLAIEDPQHTPLYFLLARVWMQGFGSSILASRLLPVMISLASLPLMYLLAMELSASSRVAWFATALLALSPVDILFAQTARQYSLLTLAVIGSGLLLLRALRLNHPRAWLLYGLSVGLGFYSHLFFLLNWIAQGSFLLWPWDHRRLLKFALASGLGLLLFSPWIVVLYVNRDIAFLTNRWSGNPVGTMSYIKSWLYSFTALLIDSDFFNPAAAPLWPRLLALLFLGFAIWAVIRAATGDQRRFILTTALVPFLLLASSDLLLGGSRSIITRYLIGSFPGVQLAMAYGLTYLSRYRNRLALAVWGLILALALTSNFRSARAETWWNKDISYNNGQVAEYLNASPSPLVITDFFAEKKVNLGNLLALSYRLEPDVRLIHWSESTEADPLETTFTEGSDTLLAYHPSQALQDRLSQAGYQLQPTEVPGLAFVTQLP